MSDLMQLGQLIYDGLVVYGVLVILFIGVLVGCGKQFSRGSGSRDSGKTACGCRDKAPEDGTYNEPGF